MLACEIVPAEATHVAILADRLRAADRNECEIAGLWPQRALWRSYRGSAIAKTAFVGGDPAAMWGCGGSMLSGIGQPWLLTTPAVERVRLTFVRTFIAEVGAMLGLYDVLYGYVAADYLKAHRVLRMAGFMIGPEVRIGGGSFRRYERAR